MTESEWNETTDIEPVLECLINERFPDAEACDWKRGERKKRLFLLACVRRIWHLLPAEYQSVCEMWEPELYGLGSNETLQEKWSAAERLSWEHENLLVAIHYDDIGSVCSIIASLAPVVSIERSGESHDKKLRQQQEQQVQASYLRDIFGNPFRHVTIDPLWLTPTATSLAQAAYEERILPSGELDTARLTLLADAFEEAGCTDVSLLEHLRSPGAHVRGCWPVDALLGKK